jgi:ribosomal protein L29
MKLNDIRAEIKKMSHKELTERTEMLRKELFGLRIDSATTHIKNYAQFKILRKDIARTLTMAHKKNLEL